MIVYRSCASSQNPSYYWNCIVRMKYAMKFKPWQYPMKGFFLEKAISIRLKAAIFYGLSLAAVLFKSKSIALVYDSG